MNTKVPPKADGGQGLREATEHSVSGASFQMVARKRYGRWVSAVILIGLLFLALRSITTNPRMQWGVVGEYFFSSSVLDGLLHTLLLTLCVMMLGIALGTVIAVMRYSGNPVLSTAAATYVWAIRSIPPLVQLLIWYNIAAVYPKVSLDLPIFGEIFSSNANEFITPFTAALLALGLNESAYMGEIIRSGISSVGAGQVEAAQSLGFSGGKTMRRVILPQAVRVIIPPTGNEVITVLKVTSLVSIISMTDLLYSVQLIYSKTFQTIPLLVVACIWYLIVTSVLALIQRTIERKLSLNNSTRPGFIHQLSGGLSRLASFGRAEDSKSKQIGGQR